MLRTGPRAFPWRIWASLLALAWLALLFAELRQLGPVALLTSLLPGLVVALTVLLAFGYRFRSARAQKGFCMAAMVLCLKRLVPAVLGSTIFFQANIIRNHWTAAQAGSARAAMLTSAVLVGIEFAALAVLSKPAQGEGPDQPLVGAQPA
jgi:uncharacterized protein YqgC (DUF456 family)